MHVVITHVLFVHAVFGQALPCDDVLLPPADAGADHDQEEDVPLPGPSSKKPAGSGQVAIITNISDNHHHPHHQLRGRAQVPDVCQHGG